MKYDIFISYRKEGGFETAKLLADRLKADGYRVFLDIEALRTGKFNNQLYQVIESCKDFILILSKNSLDRCSNPGDWVKLEILHALKNQKNIVPILLRNFSFPHQMPNGMEELELHHGITSSQEYFDASYKKIKGFFKSKPIKKQMLHYSIIVIALIVLGYLGTDLISPKSPIIPGDSSITESGKQPTENVDQKVENIQTDNCESEIDYFLNRVVYKDGKLMRYEQFIDLAFSSLKDKGLTVNGPQCLKRYDKYVIRYEVDGKSTEGALWDTNMDFEVNSQTNYFKPASELARTFNKLLDPDSRLSDGNAERSNPPSNQTSSDINTELDFFINREVKWQGKLFRYEEFVDIFTEKLKGSGLQVEGPICKHRNNNVLIRYSVKGTDNTGKIWDTNIDFQVNSRQKEFKAISTLAKTLNNLVDEE